MPINRFSFPHHTFRSAMLVSLMVIMMLALFFDSAAKMLAAGEIPAASSPIPVEQVRISPAFLRNYEARMRPFFESRIKGPRAATVMPGVPHFREYDALLLPRVWNGLSPEFKALYKAATQIPPDFQMYQSPGGHFEVFYTTASTSVSAVDPTDLFGYGTGPDWRIRTNGQNGVPDYIDETAWALDSSRSMMVDKFGFVAPLPNKDAQHTSNRYRVVVTGLGTGEYGFTWVDAKAGTKGFSSHIEMRSEWNDDIPWAELGYKQHPENGVRVTCAHELFHGVQYAMSWNSDNDDFPLTWLEGTSVLMEELGFDYINDYVQYTELFFSNPTIPFFDPDFSSMRVYTNSLLTKFIFEKGTGPDRIDLIKNVFFNNYARMTPFHANLRTSSTGLGSSWVNILNRFHTGSYYTGTRADTSRFLADAALLKEWTWLRDIVSISRTTVKPVHPYGMETFNFAPAADDGDMLSVALECETAGSNQVPYPSWGVTVIIKRLSRPDTLLSPFIDPTGMARFQTVDWRQVDEMLMIVTNGHPTAVRSATVSLLACSVTYRAGESVVLKDTVPSVKSIPDNFITVDLFAQNDLTCPLTTDYITPASVPVLPKGTMLSGIFALSYPEFWGSNATVSLTFFVRASYLESLKNRVVFSSDSVRIWRFNNSLSRWEKVQSTLPGTAPDGTTWRLSGAAPGMYALFLSQQSALDTTRMIIAPNPAKLSDKKGMHFEGGRISEIRIYSADGSLVCDTRKSNSIAFRKYIGGYIWQLVNNNGAAVAPGFYTAHCIQTNSNSGEKKSKLNKVLVFP